VNLKALVWEDSAVIQVCSWQGREMAVKLLLQNNDVDVNSIKLYFCYSLLEVR
jgi:hypothetical protein